MPITKASGQAVAPAAKGDLVVGSATNDAAVLGVGSADQVLTVDSSTTTGLKWATPAAGGMTSIATGSLSSSQTNITGISSSYIHLYLVVLGPVNAAQGSLRFRLQNDANSNYAWVGLQSGSVNPSASGAVQYLSAEFGNATVPAAANDSIYTLLIENYASTKSKPCALRWVNGPSSFNTFTFGAYDNSAAITEINVYTTAGTFGGGTYTLYGVK